MHVGEVVEVNILRSESFKKISFNN